MANDQECVDYARECIRLAELTKDLQLRDWLLTTAREWMATAETKRSRAGIARLSWSASLFELAMSASGHKRTSGDRLGQVRFAPQSGHAPASLGTSALCHERL